MGSHASEEMAKSLLNEPLVENRYSENLPPIETEERISTRTELEGACAEKEQEGDITANEMVSECNLVTTSPRQGDKAEVTVVNRSLTNIKVNLQITEKVCLNAANGRTQNKELEHSIANEERGLHALDEMTKSLLNEASAENEFSENPQPIETEERISTRTQLEEAYTEKEQEVDITTNEMVSEYNLVTKSPRQDDQAMITVVNEVLKNGEDESLKTAEKVCLNAANDQEQNKELEHLIANEERGLHALDEMTKSLLNEASAENEFSENPQPIETEERISTRTQLQEACAEKEQEGDVTPNEMVSEYNLVTISPRQNDQAEVTVVNRVSRNGEDEPLKTAENICLNIANDQGQNKVWEHSIANEERGPHSLDEMAKSLLNEASAENEFSENPQPMETEEMISTRTYLEEACAEKEQEGDITENEMVSKYNLLTTSPTQVDQAEVTVVNGVLRNGEDELLKTAEIICLNAANDQGQNKELEHLGTNEERGSNVLKEMTESLLNETSVENTENISDHMYSLGFHLNKMSNSLGAGNEETESIMQTHIGISFTANSPSDLDLISGNVLTLGISNDSTRLNSYILDDDVSSMNLSVEETVLKDGDSRTLQDSSAETQLILSGKSFPVNHSSIVPADFTYQNETNTNINLEEVALTTEIPDSPNDSSVFTDDELSLSTSLQQGLQHLVLTCDRNEHFFNSSEEEFSLYEDKHWKKDSGIYAGFNDSEFITEPKTNANIFFSSIEKTIIGTHDTSTELNCPIDTHESKFSELCNKQKEFNQISEEAENISLSTDMVYIESKSDELLSKNVFLHDQVTCFTDSSNYELCNDSSKNTIESTVKIPYDLDMQNNKYSKDIEKRGCEESELNLSDRTLQVHAFSLNHSEKTVFPEIHDDNLQLREHVDHKNSTFPNITKASFSVNSERAESKTNTSICKDSVDSPLERPRIHVYCVIGQHMPISNVQEESALIRAETESPIYQEEDKEISSKMSTNTKGDSPEDIQKHEDVHDNCSNVVPSTPGSKPFMYRQNAFEESASFNSVMAHEDQNNILERREREMWTTEEFSNPSLLFSGSSAAPDSGKGTALPFYTTSSDDSSEAAPVELSATDEELKSTDSGSEFSSILELPEKVLQKGEASPKIMLGKAISWPCHGRESLRVHASEMVLENDEAQSFKNLGLQARKRRRGFRRNEKSVSCLDEKEQHDLDKDFSSSKGNDLDETVQRRSSKITPTCTQLYQEYDAVVLERQIKRQARSDTLMDESSPPVNRKTRARNAPRLSLCSQTSQSLWQDLPGVRGSSHLEALSEKNRKLQEMKFELVSSEASYLHSLDIAVDHFQRSPALKAVLTSQDKMWLFSRLAEVREISYRFLADLEERVEQNVLMFDVCDIVLKHIPNFQSIYVPYLKNQSYQEKTFERLMETSSQFRRAVEELEKSPLCQRLPLRSFLALPFQRITRLKLLVQNILKKTLPGSREEEQATSAHRGLEKLIQQSNESIRQMRSIENLVSLSRRVDFQCRIFPLVSQARWLQKEGEVTHLLEEGNGRISKKSVYLHLFNDVLLLSHHKEGGRFSVFEHNSARKLRVENCQMKLHSLQKNLFQLHLFQTSEGGKASFVFRTEKQSEKFRWISALSPPPPKIDYFGCNDCKQVQCIRAYVAQQPDELSLEKADLLLVHQQTSDGWTEGTRVSDGERGWFPNSHIDLIVSHQARLRNLKERQRIVNATCRQPNS
ncbi:ARHG5 factor, partial [Polypterus senegalus]